MKNYLKIITSLVTGSFLVASVMLSPVLVSAKNGNGNSNGNNGNHGENDKSESQIHSNLNISSSAQVQNGQGDENEQGNSDNDSDRNNATSSGPSITGCIQAFGHLIAPGWIKHNGQLSIGEDCALPFGIAKKLGEGNGSNGGGTTTPDTTAPILSTITSVAGTTSVQVSWMTNEFSTSKVYYSSASSIDINSSTTLAISNGSLQKSHVLNVIGLTPSTTYYFVVQSADAAGNVATSSVFSVTTLSASSTPDTTPPVLSIIASTVGTSSANITWTTNESATSKVFYSTSTPVDIGTSTTPSVSNGSLVTSHSLSLTGLDASTTYYVVVQSVDASGNIATSSEFSITTSSIVDITPPIISNAIAVVSTSTVNLTWNTDESATTKAYYSTTTPVDLTATSTMTAENTALVTSHALTVTGLATSTQYYMVLESQDSSGNVARSSEFTFTTAASL